ncbi:MAG: type VI secretion system ATPase TssH, partial [Clostridia bacterium]|nr:type VI secretion system ATPase TssH [Clostridia bacterium]
KPLTRENINSIVDLLLADLSRRLAEKQLSVKVTERAKDYIVDRGYDPVYGARPLKRYLQSQVETLIARKIIGGGVAAGDTITVDYDGNKLTV